jgi:putative ABC transport system substrate-binding protein
MNELRRRQIVIASGVFLCASGRSVAQQTARVYRIGILQASPSSASQFRSNGGWAAFIERLAIHGYIEGQNLQIEVRSTEGKMERLPELAAELVTLKPDVLTAITNPPVLALQRATNTIPIVMMGHESVALGLVASLARPGGNITGMDGVAPELEPKRLQILHELAPRTARIAALYNPTADPAMRLHFGQVEDAARKLGIEVRPFEVRRNEDFESVFAALVRERSDGLIAFTDSLVVVNGRRIADFARESKLPSIFEFSIFVDFGGLASYGTNLLYFYKRAADFVHRILGGAKPDNLPVEFPTTFEMVVNLKTARSLGLMVSPLMQLRADRLVQ